MVLVSLDPQGERSFNFYRHNTADTQYGRPQIDEINWQNIAVFHFCSNTLTSESMHQDTLYAIEDAKMNDAIISFDVNLRQQLWHDLTLLPSRVEACLSTSDIVKLSKDEAEYLANTKQISLEAYYDRLLSLGVKLILVSDGANAVKLITPCHTSTFEVPSINAVDTTAAGDSFISGFLFNLTSALSTNKQTLDNMIEKPEQLSSAVLFGIKCGAYTCQKKGAFAALPSFSNL